MFKKIFSILVAVAMLVVNFSGWTSTAAVSTETQSEIVEVTDNYEIYPIPQNQTYLGTSFSITGEVNLVIEPTIDESTRNFLKQILESKSIKYTQSEKVVSDRTNIIIGTRDSNGYVDNFFSTNINYDSAIFNETDAYVLNIDKELETNGTIAILGDNTDSAYYALATLKMIFDQISGKVIQSVKYEDYSDLKWRGFIEGFYGFPWSHEDRKSLMRFGGQFKMNSYIFAPKDDKYHNSSWRTLYPEDELAKIRELVDVGHESKTQFVWAIHPGFNMINWNDYDNELNTLLIKLDQLYEVGVRQFGLFMDDISTSQALSDKDKHVQLITDVANWVASKGDVRSLIYCPPFYNQSWTGSSGRPYLEALGTVPENVEIIWTGRGVVGTVNEADMQWPKDAHGRDPYMWLNWPVNDYKDSRLMLGKGEVLRPGTHNLAGVVTNPMGQAQLSKIALFAVADFTWNVDDFNDEQSWLDSFKYIAPEVASELNTIAYHLSDPSPSGHGLVLGESENIKSKLESFLNKFKNEESVEEAGNQLIAELDNVLKAIIQFRDKSQNKKMVEEIDPWLNSLSKVVESSKNAAESAISLQNGDIDSAWEKLAMATNYMSESKKFQIKKLNYPDVTVEAGTKRLVPFANELIDSLDAKIYTSIDNEAMITSPITSYDSHPDLNKMIDGDKSSYVYIQTIQKNGDWYGLDFGKTIKINDVEIIQGRNDGDHDIFQRGILEYSQDAEDWIAIGEERSGSNIAEKGLNIEARYVRYRLTHAGIPGGKPDLWTAVREFTVNASKRKVSLYTNVTELRETEVNASEVSGEISNINNITLKPSQYLGMKFTSIEQISDIALESTNSDVVLQSSENGVEWENVTLGRPYSDAAYFRLINKKDREITFKLTKLLVKIKSFAEPVVSHNYEGVYQGKLEELFDGKLENKVWLSGMQHVGKFVQVDLGGIIDVENVAVVISDGEGDYFRKGDLQLSVDGHTWETIHTFDNPNDRSQNFPEHAVPYRYKRVQVDGKQARYVRLISTENNQYWLALNEIIVNEGIDRPGTANPSLQADPKGDVGNDVNHVIDQRLSTYYTPVGETRPGYLNYKISNQTKLSKLIVLQNPLEISNAEVLIRNTEGWQKVGELKQSFNIINTSNYEHVLEVKIQWDGSVKPKIYEIVAVKREAVSIDKLDEELQMAYEQNWITNSGILNSLLAKVDNIQKHESDKKKTLNGLNALENQIKGLSGKKIDGPYAKVLLGIIAELKNGEV